MKMVLCIHLAVRPNKALPCKTVNFIMYNVQYDFDFSSRFMTIVEILEQTFDGGSTPMGKFIWRRSAAF